MWLSAALLLGMIELADFYEIFVFLQLIINNDIGAGRTGR
jgi:hypothetical protein